MRRNRHSARSLGAAAADQLAQSLLPVRSVALQQFKVGVGHELLKLLLLRRLVHVALATTVEPEEKKRGETSVSCMRCTATI